ncbi:MAG: DNA sulfur modification protein DndD [Bacteroidetes bacterium]|nr:MAG: DNA sulfur modification protein DndD [Bacteroidota bacterium]
MIIKRVKAKNFKTYLVLDLDLSVSEERPIVLIGGANGGGKTTLFEAIYGALYGLEIRNARQFRELLNAGALGQEDERIELELHFSGRVLNTEQQYVLSRTYVLNPQEKPVESVRLNMDGNIFVYGTATPAGQRQEAEAQVNKIIKANLPQELSRYFLFDAMEAGNLLKEDQLNRVIRENIENVMGFNKYLSLARASETLVQEYTAQRLQAENEKKEYLALVAEKNSLEQKKEYVSTQHQKALEYSVVHQDTVEQLRAGQNHEAALKQKIEQMEGMVAAIEKKEATYHHQAEDFSRNFDQHICHPKLAEAMKHEVALVLKAHNEQTQRTRTHVGPEQLDQIVGGLIDFLRKRGLASLPASRDELVSHLASLLKDDPGSNPYAFLEESELKALEQLVNGAYQNPYLGLQAQQEELNVSLRNLENYETQIEQLKSQIAGQSYDLLREYEENELNIKRLHIQIKELEGEIEKIDRRIHQFDIQTSQEPDPRFEALQKLKPFFEEVTNALLKAKKQQIEVKMKQDLNTNLAAYKDVVDRVALSEDLRDLTFKIYHKRGNEIYLNQLNTASKQVVIQVLLKALHEYGDYDPPVMIDTVMGVLDETSRATVLENYFPELSHQTILLSSDSEIRPGQDLSKIEPFVSKAYTLKRDREQQRTDVVLGYFNKQIED